MTQLLIDVGNTRLKWALSGGDALSGHGAVEHGGDPAAALAGLALPAEIQGTVGWAANVTGARHEAALGSIARERHGIELRFAVVRAECRGLRIAYADPSRLGVDRWLQMLALWSERQEAFVVAAAGTALTFDAVDTGGRHLGGVIAPGLLAGQQAVLGATRFFARGPDMEYATGLGSDTEACVRQGALHACSGLLERLADRHARNAERRIISGGDAALLLQHLQPGWHLRADLVLGGLRTLASL